MAIALTSLSFNMKFKYSGPLKNCATSKSNSKGTKDISPYTRIVFYTGCSNFLLSFDILYCWSILIPKTLTSLCEGY